MRDDLPDLMRKGIDVSDPFYRQYIMGNMMPALDEQNPRQGMGVGRGQQIPNTAPYDSPKYTPLEGMSSGQMKYGPQEIDHMNFLKWLLMRSRGILQGRNVPDEQLDQQLNNAITIQDMLRQRRGPQM